MMNQRGFIAMDFVFALVIALGMSAILFAMTFTLSVVEVGQYMTYSAARAQAAAGRNPVEQEESARKKYSRLLGNRVLAPLFKNGWFEISAADKIEVKGGDTGTSSQGSFRKDYPGTSGFENRAVFTGVRTRLTAKMLEMKFPIIGSTSDDSEGGFSTAIATVLIREPSQEECQKFMKDRYSKMMALDSRFNDYGNHQQDYLPMEDNGC